MAGSIPTQCFICILTVTWRFSPSSPVQWFPMKCIFRHLKGICSFDCTAQERKKKNHAQNPEWNALLEGSQSSRCAPRKTKETRTGPRQQPVYFRRVTPPGSSSCVLQINSDGVRWMGRAGRESLEQHSLLSPVWVYQGGDDLLELKDTVDSGASGSHLAWLCLSWKQGESF